MKRIVFFCLMLINLRLTAQPDIEEEIENQQELSPALKMMALLIANSSLSWYLYEDGPLKEVWAEYIKVYGEPQTKQIANAKAFSKRAKMHTIAQLPKEKINLMPKKTVYEIIMAS